MTSLGAAPIANRPSYVAHACTIISLGVFYLLSPDDWYGPSWSYFYNHGVPILPGGFGLGACLIGIGAAQLIVLWRNTTRWLPTLFFMSGATFWLSSFILAMEGLMGHHGIQEAPLLFVIGTVKFIVMVNLIVARKKSLPQ